MALLHEVNACLLALLSSMVTCMCSSHSANKAQTKQRHHHNAAHLAYMPSPCSHNALTVRSQCPYNALAMPSQCPHHAVTAASQCPHCAFTTHSQRIHNALTMPSLCPHNGPPLMPSPCPQCALTMGPPQCPHSGPTMLQISTCNDLTSSSCELTADGVGAVQGFTQLSDTSYQIDVQVRDPALCL